MIATDEGIVMKIKQMCESTECWVLFLLAAMVSWHAAADRPEVSFQKDEGQVQIEVGGKPFATYVWQDDNIPRPYFCHVKTPNEMQVTRRHPPDPVVNRDNDDHATYHPGIWLAFGDLGGADFWRNKARVRHVKFSSVPKGGAGTGTFSVVNSYETQEATPKVICVETCEYTIHATHRGYFLIAESVFKSDSADFAFGDQEEMGLGVRLATALTVRHGNGTITNSEGGKNEKGTWGKQAAWCSYTGVIDDQRLGLTLMPDPRNFRESWYHSRDYGFVAANPFGKKAMTGADDKNVPPDSTVVRKGETFALGFGVHIFSMPTNRQPDPSAAYIEYLKLIGQPSTKKGF